MNVTQFDRSDDVLLRFVIPGRGKPYRHTCSRAAFEAVAHRFDESRGGLRIEDVVVAESLPFTAVAVAIDFLEERGLVERVYSRRRAAVERYTFEDAMTEFWALGVSDGVA